nr:VWA domain-containing protein [Haliscomenobacter sp.]
MKHYQVEYKSIIPEKLWGYGRRQPKMKDLILLVDQSGSMAASVVYAGIIGSIMASMPSITTRFIVFDTSVVDLTEQLHDAVDLLFATQLGGGTHISKALRYGRQHIRQPRNTIMVLISDLMEGGPAEDLIRQAMEIKASGVNLIALLPSTTKEHRCTITTSPTSLPNSKSPLLPVPRCFSRSDGQGDQRGATAGRVVDGCNV